ncbi:MAG: radical SAM protein [Ectothiorhodospiraceae bacterium]|nr:radical SAM protein [Ectothiorhodospiraceae bacterium]
MGASTEIYLADLRHTYMGVLGSDAMPLNIGYLKAVMDRDVPDVRSRLFVYPDRLLGALREAPPQVLMLSNYTWNEQLSLHAARVAKSVRPDTLVVMGGPNIHDEPDRQMSWVRDHPEVDVYLLGEGDFLAAELAQAFVDAGCDAARLKARDIHSAVYQRPDGEMVRNPVQKRRRNLDDIPSPWLTGVMDEFFDGKLAPLWETNRGCPFTCSFCVQGTEYYNRVTYFDEARLREEIDYIGRMIHERSPNMGVLRIADPNYGMYRRDTSLSEAIGQAQRKYSWPTFIDATTGKNRPDRIIESLEKVGGALVLYQAVQSLDEEVLRNIKRENIKLDAYEALQVHMRGRGLKSSSDLILGLPTETLASHLDGLSRMIDLGVTRLNNFQCMMLRGVELERRDSRERFGLETRYRVVPKSFGVYEGQAVFEDEEIVVATDALSFDDYFRARLHHFACACFLNTGRLETLLSLVESFGAKRSELFRSVVDALQADNATVGALLASFLAETRSELFESREAMLEFYSDEDNIKKLARGEIGDNLMYKYASLGQLRIWSAVSAMALSVTRAMLESRDAERAMPGFQEFWQDFSEFQTLRYASGLTLEELVEPRRAAMRYDIARWIADGLPHDVRPYRLAAGVEATFALTPDKRDEIERAVRVYGLSPAGATMLIKRVRASSLERTVTMGAGALPDEGRTAAA